MAIPLRLAKFDVVLKIYYENPEIGNAEIGELWQTRSSSTIKNLKKKAQDLMNEKGVKAFGVYKVNTAIAFEAWGLDISDLEKRRNKLRKLGLAG